MEDAKRLCTVHPTRSRRRALKLTSGFNLDDFPSLCWEPFAATVLEAAYEATMWAAVLNANRGKSDTVLLTFLGGGDFGNEDRWIHTAIPHQELFHGEGRSMAPFTYLPMRSTE
jgi:hypothetical protein